MSALEVGPDYGGPVVPPEWWACEHPERPHDDEACYHPPGDLCAGCVIAAEAALAQGALIGRYLDVVGECEAEAGRPAVPGRPWP